MSNYNLNGDVKDAADNFLILSDMLKKYIKKAENVQEILEVGAKEFVKDLKRLTKPYSKIHKSDYTHLIDTFTYEKSKTNNDIFVGWGKYYGRIVEYGSNKMSSRSHLRPVFDRNKEKYYKLMIDRIDR